MALPTYYDAPQVTNPGYVSYTATGGQDTFAIPFDYPQKDKINDGDVSKFITARVEEKDESYTITTDGTTLVLDTPALLNEEVEIFRDSDIEELLSFTEAGSPITQENLQDYQTQIQDLGAEQLQRTRWLENERVTAPTELQEVLDAAALLIDFRERIDQITLDLDAAEAEVDVSSPVDGQILIRQGTSFQNKSMSNVLMDAAGSLSIDVGVILAPMIQSSAVTSAILTNGTVTVAKFFPGVLVNNPLIFIRENIPDVFITLPQVSGEVLIYDETPAGWVNIALSGEVTGFDRSGRMELSPGVVVEATLVSDAVSTAKFRDLAIEPDHILDANVLAVHQTPNNVFNENYAPKSITFGILSGVGLSGAGGAITTDKMMDGIFTGPHFQDAELTDSKFADSTITGEQISTADLTGVLTSNLSLTILQGMANRFRASLGSQFVVGAIFGKYASNTPPEKGVFSVFGGTVTGNYLIDAAGVFTWDDAYIDIDDDPDIDIARGENPDTGSTSLGKVIVNAVNDDLTDLGNAGEVTIQRGANLGVSELDDAKFNTQARGSRTTTDNRSFLLNQQILDGETTNFRVHVTARDIRAGGDYSAHMFNGYYSRDGAVVAFDVLEDPEFPKREPAGWTNPEPLIQINGTRFEILTGSAPGGGGAPIIDWCCSIYSTKVHQ